MRLGLLTGAAALAILFVASASATDHRHELKFAAGSTSATVEGAVVRGDSDIWSFAASAGQNADISITSLEDNASFAVFLAPATIEADPTIADVKSWQGALPSAGTTYVQVSGDRGNATYKLTVSIK